MMRPRWSDFVLQLTFLPFITTPLASQAASSAPPDSATALGDSAGAANPAPSVGGFKVSGYVEASYAYSGRAVGDTIVGRLYDRFSNQFTLNALKVALDRPFATDRWDAGVHADLLIGQNAPLLQSSGFSLGPSGDVTQLYVTLNVPTPNGNGLQFKAGKLVTLMGVELIEDVANPNWSEGLQFIYVENFTSTGIEAGYKLSPHADVQLRLSNGWDRVAGNGGHKDFMGRVGVYPGATTSIGLVGYYGAQEVDGDAMRHGGNVIINQKIGGLSVWLQGDYGKEQANAVLPDSTRDAEWWALGTWLAYDVTSKLGVAVRADYLDDEQGFRTSAAFSLPPGAARHKLWSATGTLNMRTWPSVVVRPEVRYDHSNQAPFDGKRSQVTAALSVAYLY